MRRKQTLKTVKEIITLMEVKETTDIPTRSNGRKKRLHEEDPKAFTGPERRKVQKAKNSKRWREKQSATITRLEGDLASANAKLTAQTKEYVSLKTKMALLKRKIATSGNTVKTETEIVVKTEPGIVVKTEPGIVAKTEPGIVVKTEPGIVAKTEPGIIVKTEPGIVVKTEPGIVAKTESGIVVNTESGIVVNTESGIVVKMESDNGLSDSEAHSCQDKKIVCPNGELTLEIKYGSLQGQYESLKEKYASLEEKYASLKAKHESLSHIHQMLEAYESEETMVGGLQEISCDLRSTQNLRVKPETQSQLMERPTPTDEEPMDTSIVPDLATEMETGSPTAESKSNFLINPDRDIFIGYPNDFSSDAEDDFDYKEVQMADKNLHL